MKISENKGKSLLKPNEIKVLKVIGALGNYASLNAISKHMIEYDGTVIMPSNVATYVEKLASHPFSLLEEYCGKNPVTNRVGRWWELNERGVIYLDYEDSIEKLINKRQAALDCTLKPKVENKEVIDKQVINLPG